LPHDILKPATNAIKGCFVHFKLLCKHHHLLIECIVGSAQLVLYLCGRFNNILQLGLHLSSICFKLHLPQLPLLCQEFCQPSHVGLTGCKTTALAVGYYEPQLLDLGQKLPDGCGLHIHDLLLS